MVNVNVYSVFVLIFKVYMCDKPIKSPLRFSGFGSDRVHSALHSGSDQEGEITDTTSDRSTSLLDSSP